MSAPVRPRFRTYSVTGYAISTHGGVGSDRAQFERWHVSDTWCNHANIYEARAGEKGKAVCERIASLFEADDLGTLPSGHGTDYFYFTKGCRCELCTAAATYKDYCDNIRRLIKAG